jgi:hypothetical protein
MIKAVRYTLNSESVQQIESNMMPFPIYIHVVAGGAAAGRTVGAILEWPGTSDIGIDLVVGVAGRYRLRMREIKQRGWYLYVLWCCRSSLLASRTGLMETCTYWFDLNMHASLAHPGYIRDAWQANEVFLACFFLMNLACFSER